MKKIIFISLFVFLSPLFLFANQTMTFMFEDGVSKSIWLKTNSELKKLETGFNFSIYPYISKDAKELLYIAGEDEKSLNVYLKNLKTHDTQKLTDNPRFVIHPSFSGDSQHIAYSVSENDKNVIKVINRNHNTTKTVRDDSHSLFFPRLSSHGEFVVYQKSISKNERQIWKYTFYNDTHERLSEHSSMCMSPALNFDDSLLAMTCFENEQWNIFVLNLRTNNVQQVTSTKTMSFAPHFDRENNLIFASNKNENFDLYKMKFSKNKKEYTQATLLLTMQGDLYSPTVSGNLSYKSHIETNIPEPARSSFATVSLNDNIYIIGGHQGREHTYPPESFIDRVDIYNVKTKTWSQGASRPVKAHGYGAAVCNGKVYAFGGFSYSSKYTPKWKSLSRIDRYEPETDSWTQVGNLRRPRSSNVVAKVDNKIYLIGGWDSTPKFENDYDGHFHTSIEVFDCENEQLTETTYTLPLPKRRAFTGVVKDNKILLIGGLGQGATHFNLLDNVTEFDPRAGTFKELSPLPFGTFAPAAGFINNQLHVFGGMFKLGEMSYEYVNHVYALEDKGWNHTGRYLSETKGFSMVLNAYQKLWVLGGHSYKDEIDAPVPTVEVWK